MILSLITQTGDEVAELLRLTPALLQQGDRDLGDGQEKVSNRSSREIREVRDKNNILKFAAAFQRPKPATEKLIARYSKSPCLQEQKKATNLACGEVGRVLL
ncbi:unnamed protein product, partial [Cyprideis torosa]